MKTKRCLGCWHLGFLGFLTTVWLSSFADRALPQSTPSNIQADDTLGAESSQIIQNFQGQPLEVITGGATRSINLFHSFREFKKFEKYLSVIKAYLCISGLVLWESKKNIIKILLNLHRNII